ncbi:MAG: hypothetical protein ABI488_10285 [Polyangiaceae bacterium]
MKRIRQLLQGSTLKLTRAACIFALLGLALMSYSIFDPRAIPVIVAMSVGHVFGISAFLCYLLAIVLDAPASATGQSVSQAPTDTRHDSHR